LRKFRAANPIKSVVFTIRYLYLAKNQQSKIHIKYLKLIFEILLNFAKFAKIYCMKKYALKTRVFWKIRRFGVKNRWFIWIFDQKNRYVH